MNNKQLKEILTAMMYASGLDPEVEGDYYQGLNGGSIGRFFEGICRYFDVERGSWMFSFNNITYLECPSDTLRFFIIHKDLLVGE